MLPGLTCHTPVQFTWTPGQNGQSPNIGPNSLPAPVVTATTASFTFNVFKPNTTATIYYGTNAPGTCNLNNPHSAVLHAAVPEFRVP